MKLPRWLVTLMLTTSMLSVLVAAGWWWVTWPGRTAREFVVRLTANQDEPSWKQMIVVDGDPHGWVQVVISSIPPRDWSDVEPQSRDPVDLCMGRQRFRILHNIAWEFTSERGKVIGPSPEISKVVVGELVVRREEERRQKELELFERKVHRQVPP